VPDETTICRFQHLLDTHDFGRRMFERVHEHLEAKGCGFQAARFTIVDATIIHAPSSAKNEEKALDPDMHQTKEGNQWCVSRTEAADLRCCTEDRSRAPEADFKPSGAAASNGRGGERPDESHLLEG
jgi:hypothetical protein